MTMTAQGSAAGAPPKTTKPGSGEGRSLGALALIGVGAFVITAGVLAQTYLPGHLKLAPVDTNEVTEVSGTALLPANFSDPGNLEQAPVKVFKITKADQNVSDGSVVAYNTFTCLVLDEGGIKGCVSSDDPEGRLVNASQDRFATDRSTGEAVNTKKYLGPEGTTHDGLVNKWPFDAQKKTYKIWDSITQSAVDATYSGTEKLDGLETYVYKTAVNADNVEILDGVQGSYQDNATYYVEPKTGSIVNQTDKQERLIGGTALVLQLDVKFTAAEMKQSIDDAKSNVSALKLATTTGPLIAYPVGLLLIGLGVLVGRRKKTRQA